MTKELASFRAYAQEVLGESYKEVDVQTVVLQETGGHFFYTLMVYLDGKLCRGTGNSWNRAIENAVACLADYQPEYERVNL